MRINIVGLKIKWNPRRQLVTPISTKQKRICDFCEYNAFHYYEVFDIGNEVQLSQRIPIYCFRALSFCNTYCRRVFPWNLLDAT